MQHSIDLAIFAPSYCILWDVKINTRGWGRGRSPKLFRFEEQSGPLRCGFHPIFGGILLAFQGVGGGEGGFLAKCGFVYYLSR